MDDKNIRLIDANALVADYRICGGCKDFKNCDGHVVMCDSTRVRQAINDAPTIEARPVKHGTWKYSKTEGLPTNRFVCSECYGLTIVSTYRNRCMLGFCPNCSAEMEDEAEIRYNARDNIKN